MHKNGLYIHIPICRRRCSYCDFYLVTNLSLTQNFLTALKKEIEISSHLYKKDSFDTIFFGGGTPSLLESYQIREIIETLMKHYNVDKNSEITIESNPEDFIRNPVKLKELRLAEVNRLSLGIQSFNDKELKFLTRLHNSAQSEIVINKAMDIFDNISVDLIYSLPEQNNDDIKKSLLKVIQLGIKHISAYTLIYEKETILYKNLLKNIYKPKSDPKEAEMYKLFSNILLENNYQHYEVSNYSKPGYKSRHNLKYWNYSNYIGFGPSAHSFYSGKRWNNSKNVIKYINLLEKNILPEENVHQLSADEAILEFIMLGLRAEGIDIDTFNGLFKSDFLKKYESSVKYLIKEGYAFFDKNKFKLNETGYAITDEIVSRYF